MADVKISELPNAAPLGSGDAFEITQGGESKQASGSQVSTLVTGSSELAASINPRFNATAGRQGLRLDGLSGLLNTVEASDLFAEPFSISWFHRQLKTPVSGARIAALGATNAHFLNESDGGGMFQYFLRTDGTGGRFRWTYPPVGELAHYTFTFDPSDLMSAKLYKNGVEMARTVATTPTGNLVVPSGKVSFGGPTTFNSFEVSDIIYHSYILPPTTENGIKGVLERYRDGSFLTAEDLFKSVDIDGIAVNSDNAGRQFASITGASETGVTAEYDDSNATNRLGWPLSRVIPAGVPTRIRFKFDAELNGASLNMAMSTNASLGGETTSAVAVAEGSNDIIHEFTGTNVLGYLRFQTTGTVPSSGSLVISNLSIEIQHATLALTSESIQPERGQWLDVSANRLHALQSATGTSLIKRLSTGLMVVEGVNATSAVFLFGARNILTDDWTVESVEVFNDGASSADIDLEFSNGSAHVNLTGATTTIAAGTSKRLQVVNGKPTAYNRIRATGNAGADDMRFILALKPRR